MQAEGRHPHATSDTCVKRAADVFQRVDLEHDVQDPRFTRDVRDPDAVVPRVAAQEIEHVWEVVAQPEIEHVTVERDHCRKVRDVHDDVTQPQLPGPEAGQAARIGERGGSRPYARDELEPMAGGVDCMHHRVDASPRALFVGSVVLIDAGRFEHATQFGEVGHFPADVRQPLALTRVQHEARRMIVHPQPECLVVATVGGREAEHIGAERFPGVERGRLEPQIAEAA